jgi:hypothetical protein
MARAQRRKWMVIGSVLALLAGGLVSGVILPASAAGPFTQAHIDFTSKAGAIAAGYDGDRGTGYTAATGYGWVAPGTQTPVSITQAYTRSNPASDQRLRTVTYMQGTTPGDWQIDLVNGSYDVTVAVGDYGFVDSTHVVTANGTPIIDHVVPTKTNYFPTATKTVQVTNGKLVLSAAGGTNTKIDYVDIAPVSSAPTVSASVSGSQDGSGDYQGTATLTLTTTGDVASTTYAVNGGAAQTYTAPVGFSTPGSYTVAATATSPGGQTATTSVSFTVVAAPAPTISASVSGSQNASNDYQGTATLTLTTTGVGVTTTYAVNGGATQTYSAPVAFSTPGSYSVAATATDGFGQTATTTATFTVVSAPPTAPTIAASLAGSQDGSGNYQGTATLTLTTTGSGVTTTYTVNGGAAQAYTAPVAFSTPGTYTVVGTAKDSANQTATASTTFTVVTASTGPTQAHIDFTSKAGAIAAGYTGDRANPYSAGTGFGWLAAGTQTPVNLTQAYTRSNPADQRLKTVTYLQGTTPADWRINLANGSYDVTVAVGDYGFTDSAHSIAANGVSLLNRVVPTKANYFPTATKTVQVTNGTLVLSAAGGTNTKIDYVDIVPAGAVAPTVAASVSGTRSGSNYVGTATLTLTSTGNGVTTTYTVNGGAAQAYSAPVAFSTPGTYTVVGTAKDATNQTATASVTFTVVANAAPTITANLSGTQNGSGNYQGSAQLTLTTTGTGVTTTYTVNGGAAQAYSGPVSFSTPGTYTVVGTAKDSANQTATATVTFTVVAVTSTNGRLAVSNNDTLPFPDRIVLSRIQVPEDGSGTVPANSVHDTGVFTLTNSGTGPLTVSSLTVGSVVLPSANFSGSFTATPSVALPRTLAVGASMTVTVKFVSSNTNGTDLASGTAKAVSAVLTVGTDESANPSRALQLQGLWSPHSEHDQEPSLQQIVAAEGYSTAITYTGQTLRSGGEALAVGEEVLSGTWLRADLGTPVSVTQLAAYHTQGNTAVASWYVKGSTTTAGATTTLFSHNPVFGQTVLPARAGQTSGLATGTFTPSASTTAFGFKIDGEYSQDTINVARQGNDPNCNTAQFACGHHVRFFPVRDRSGVLVPNTYVMSMDYSGINYDFQDNVYLVQNIKPETAADPAASSRLPGAALTSTDFSAPVAGTAVLDATGKATGFQSTQVNKLGNQTQPARLTLANGVLSYVAYGTATAGSSSGTDNTQVNAVQVPFNASLEAFSVQTRLNGISSYNSTGRSSGVFFGQTQDEYFKLQLVSVANVPKVQLLSETGGVASQVGAYSATVPLTTGSVDLALVGDPLTSTVTGLYRVVNNGTAGPWTVVASSQVSASRYVRVFARQQQGGLYGNAKGSTEFTAVFDSFGVTPDDVRYPDGTAIKRYDIGLASGTSTDSQGRVWSNDAGIFSPSNAIVEDPDNAAIANAPAGDRVIYDTYRGNTNQASQANRSISYAVPVGTAGTPVKVRVRLYFAERYSGNNAAGKRVFGITAEGRQVAADFDTFAAAGGQNAAVTLTVPNLTVTDGVLNLDMKALRDYAGLNALEVVAETAP